MPRYILLGRYSPRNLKRLQDNPASLRHIREELEAWEATIVHEYTMLGIYDHCVVFEMSDNFRAQLAVLKQDFCDADSSELMAAIDLPLFEEMLKKEIRTEGPHNWQIKWWARAIRMALRWYHYDRWIWKYCKPFTVTGRDNFCDIKGPCIVIGNHVSHMDALVLFSSLPLRIQSNIYFGAAADRWFLRKGGGRKELALLPWYNSLIGGSFPITRGGGARTLDYSKWLLDNGANLGIFPEGTRSTSRHLARFKHGVSLLATEKNVPIVPVYLAGTANLRPKGRRQVTPAAVSAHIQPPIYLPEDIEVPDATQLIYRAVNAVHERVLAHGPQAGDYQYQQ